MQAREILFNLLRSQICGGELQEDLAKQLTAEKLEELYHLSAQHDLAHIVGKALEKLPVTGGDAVLPKFRKQTLQAVYRYIKLDHEYQRICQMLESRQIPYLPLKGSVLRAYYPEPWMRTSSDIDILVKEQDLDQAEAILTKEMGYVKHSKNAHHISMASADDVRLELHYSLLEEQYSEVRNQMLGQMWQIVTPAAGTEFCCEMPDEMFYFYHIAHMAKHMIKGGCGIRPLLDLWILNHRIDGDRQKRKALLEQGELLAFAQAAEALSEVWFSGAQSSELLQNMEVFIVTGGVNGSLENSVAVRKGRTGSKLGYLMSRVFVGYKVLHGYYPILEKHRYLQPFCWLHWWLKRVFGGGGYRLALEMKAQARIAAQEENTAVNLIEQLGL